VPAAPEPGVLVPEVPLAEGRPAEGRAAGGQAASPAGTASPAVSATRARNPRWMARRAGPGCRGMPATPGPAQLRAGPAGHSRPAAPKRYAAGPARGGRARGR
jgi:hypothetical protein